MRWWEEIKTKGISNLCFGGPTRLYTLIVLMSWWCSLLKNQPDSELVDYHCTLKDINCAFVATIRGVNNSPLAAAPSPSRSLPGMSAILQAPKPHGAK